MSSTSNNGSGDQPKNPFDEVFGPVADRGRPVSPPESPVYDFQEPVPQKPPKPGKPPKSPKASKVRNKGGKGKRFKALVVVAALVAGGVYGYQHGLFDQLRNNKPDTAQAAPQQTTPKTTAGWQCNKWTATDGTSLIGRAKSKATNAALAAKQKVVQGPVQAATDLAVASHATPSAVVMAGCGSNLITTNVAGSVGGTSTTLYDLASVTKPFIATRILMLANEGKLKLTDPVGKYLPQWQTPEKKTVTILMLLQHTSGLPGEADDGEYANVIGNETSAAVIEANIANQKLTHKPGTFVYSNLGYVTLYLVGNKVTGKINRDMRTNLFEPLGMNNTVYLPGKSRQCAPTHPYEDSKATLTCQARDLLARKTGGVTGNAGLFSTASDMAKFAAMLASGGKLNGKVYLTPADMKLLRTALPASHFGYSTGMWTNKVGRWGSKMGRLTFGGYGDTGAAFSVDPVTGYWVVYLNNSSPTGGKLGQVKERAIKESIKKINDTFIIAANKVP